MISYEVAIGLIILCVCIPANSFNFSHIIVGQGGVWFVVPLFPMFVLFCVSALAETHRVPFDLTEGESELVSGYHVEYGAMSFALFFLAEYLHLLFMAAFISILFFGGRWLFLKGAFFVLFFIWVRGTFPRVRYDQLMGLLWKAYLPLSLGYLSLVFGVLVGFV